MLSDKTRDLLMELQAPARARAPPPYFFLGSHLFRIAFLESRCMPTANADDPVPTWRVFCKGAVSAETSLGHNYIVMAYVVMYVVMAITIISAETSLGHNYIVMAL